MTKIRLLDSETIDKIAAGEVVEHPASVVKELVENAIDAGSDAITVEIREGGIELIRVTDNGGGIPGGQLRNAFMRHATSKIQSAQDLSRISSLGFRGEALSSIAAVARVEVITKCADSLVGSRLILEGGQELSLEEVGAPDGTTMIVRDLFYNTPVRRKFLKQPATEGGYISDLMEHMALSRPDISFKFILGKQTRFHTSGNGDLREVIYRIYGRDTMEALIPMDHSRDGITVKGYLGKPALLRSNRNFEIYYINGRYIRSTVLGKAIEEGYREYLMHHRFPFCVLHIGMDSEAVDVNVHPTKMDVRFQNGSRFPEIIGGMIYDTLREQEMIPQVTPGENRQEQRREQELRRELWKQPTPEPFEVKRTAEFKVQEELQFDALVKKEPVSYAKTAPFQEEMRDFLQNSLFSSESPRFLSEESRIKCKVLGQIFDTYWLVEFDEKLLIIDQHAAHEKVKYERLLDLHRNRQITSQNLMPPLIISLSGREESILLQNMDTFAELGFEVEAFGGTEYALRAVPSELYGCSEKTMFLEILDELSAEGTGGLHFAQERLAQAACKAAVKGNTSLSASEADALIRQLMTLENPYTCPHGRPTIISMTKGELERKFKRIV